jgi:hypothetical protein
MQCVAQKQLEALVRIASALERLTYLARSQGAQTTFDFSSISSLLDASERADLFARIGVKARLGMLTADPEPDRNNN